MNTTQTRRPATDADLTVGATVYMSNGKVAYRIARVAVSDYDGKLYASVLKATSTDTSRNNWKLAAALTVES